MQTARKLLGTILRAPAPWRVRLEATLHLTMPLVGLTMFAMLLLLPLAWLGSRHDPDRAAFLLGGLAALLALGGGGAYIVAGQVLRGRGLLPALLRVPLLMAVGAGLAPTVARAVLEGLAGRHTPFIRTPKPGGRPDPQTRLRRIPLGTVELALGLLIGLSVLLAQPRGWLLPAATITLLLAAGLCWLGGAAVGHEIATSSRLRPSNSTRCIATES